MKITGCDYQNGTLFLRIPPCAEVYRFISYFKEGEFEINKKKKHRSNDQNALMWELCSLISGKIQEPTVEVYKKAVRDYGQTEVVSFANYQSAKQFMAIWNSKGIGWQAEVIDVKQGTEMFMSEGKTEAKMTIDKVDVLIYYGSSVYDKIEFRRLLDGIIQEAKQLGIDTTEERFRSLYEV